MAGQRRRSRVPGPRAQAGGRLLSRGCEPHAHLRVCPRETPPAGLAWASLGATWELLTLCRWVTREDERER